MTTLAHRSTWLASALYHAGYLTLFLLDGTALLYANVPSWIPGLLSAHRSPGRAYNLLVKGNYPYQHLDAAQAREINDLIALRKAGCACERPLLGYRPGVGPRCRLCNIIAKVHEINVRRDIFNDYEGCDSGMDTAPALCSCGHARNRHAAYSSGTSCADCECRAWNGPAILPEDKR